MKKITLLSFILTLIATPAIAEGMYVGVKLGQANYDFSNVTNNDQAAFGFLAGFNVNEHAIVEVEYDNLGGFDTGPGTAVTSNGNVTGSAFSLSGIGLLPLNRQLSLFGKLGMSSTTLTNQPKPGFTGNDIVSSNLALNFGMGIQYNISPYVGVRAGLDSFEVGNASVGTDKARMLYMGAIFKM